MRHRPVLFSLSLAYFACSTEVTVPTTPVSSVAVSPVIDTILETQTIQLSAIVRDAAGNVMTDQTVIWSSSNEPVATVTAGTVTGIDKGSALIIATSEGVSGTAAVVVRARVASVSISTDKDTSFFRQKIQYRATVRDDDGDMITDRRVFWTSSNQAVALVDSTGLATGMGPGSVSITGTADGEGATKTRVIKPLRFGSIRTGGGNTCGVTLEGLGYCWGRNTGYGSAGKLGTGDTLSSTVPVPVARGLLFREISPGDAQGFYTRGVTNGNDAFCWGLNSGGVMGTGDQNPSLVPVPVAGGLAFQTISASVFHSCGITVSRAAYCWGYDNGGQLGNGVRGGSMAPDPVEGGLLFKLLTLGSNQTCGLSTGGEAYCWGANIDGLVFGNGQAESSQTPVPASGGIIFDQLSLAADNSPHACGVTTTGAAYCWGDNTSAQIGDGSTTNRSVPVAVGGGVSFGLIVAGGETTCALSTTGQRYCWGSNDSGEFGNGTTVGSSTPLAMPDGPTFRTITMGCGVTIDNIAYCWGTNYSGEVGDGTATTRLTPTLVKGQE